jgi:FtsH-binding integral membrane protein
MKGIEMTPSDDYVGPRAGFPSAVADQASAFLSAVYGWMCVGLAITAGTAWFVAGSPAIVHAIVTSRGLFWALFIVQLGIVWVLSARAQQLAASTASVLFVLYSAVTGVTVSIVLLAYTGESVSTTFVVTAVMFGGLAAYGTITRRDLGGVGQFLFMGLIGVVVASLVGLFWHSDAFQFVLSFLGVIVFSGLAVYDAQRLKIMALQTPDGQASSYAIVGALTLYLDFTNLFLFLLRFTGNRKD